MVPGTGEASSVVLVSVDGLASVDGEVLALAEVARCEEAGSIFATREGYSFNVEARVKGAVRKGGVDGGVACTCPVS